MRINGRNLASPGEHRVCGVRSHRLNESRVALATMRQIEIRPNMAVGSHGVEQGNESHGEAAHGDDCGWIHLDLYLVGGPVARSGGREAG
jgi:hypothetical protein